MIPKRFNTPAEQNNMNGLGNIGRTVLSVFIPVLVMALPFASHAAEKTYKLGHMFAKESLPDRAAKKFAEVLAARSQGQLKVQVYPEGLLGDERENLAQLLKGALHFAVTGDVVVSNIGDKYRVVNMPFMYRDVKHALQTYESDLGLAIRKNIRAEGVDVLSWYYVGTRMLTANKPIHGLADIKGLQLRLPQDSAWIATWQALGANPRQVQFTELATALKVGRVDAQENPPGFIRANRLFENQKYLMTTNHMPQRQMILVAGGFWGKLSASESTLISAAARDAAQWATAQAELEQRTDLDWLTREGGMTLVEFDFRGVTDAVAGVPAALAGKEGEAIFKQIRAMR